MTAARSDRQERADQRDMLRDLDRQPGGMLARPTPDQFQLDQLRAEVARLAAENVGLRQRLSDAEDDANSWREDALELAHERYKSQRGKG